MERLSGTSNKDRFIKPTPPTQPASLCCGLVRCKRYETSQSIGWWLSFVIFFGLYIYYLRLAKPLVPSMDSVRYIGQAHDLLTGALSLRDMWHQSGSVGIMYQLVTLFEWVFWGLDTRLTVMFTAVVWALLFGLYVRAWTNTNSQSSPAEVKAQKPISLIAVQLLAAFYFFSPAGWEIWLLDLGFAQTLKNLMIAAYIYALSRIDYQKYTVNILSLLGGLGAAIILLASYSWSYSFTVTILFAVTLCGGLASKNTYRGLFVIIPVLIAQFIYAKESGRPFNSMAVTSDMHGIVNFITALLYGVSSIFIGGETIDLLRIPPTLLMTAGGLFFIALFIVFGFWAKFARNQRSAIFFIALGIFGCCTLISIGVARGGQGYQFAASSRYFMDFQFIFIGFLGITSYLLSLTNSDGKTIVAGIHVDNKTCLRFILVAFGALALAGQGATYFVEYRKAPYRALVYAEQSAVYLSGEISEKNAKGLQTDTATLTKAMAISSQYSLASLRNFSGKCRLSDLLGSGDVYDLEGGGRWLGKSGLLVLGVCPDTFRIEGFLPGNFSSRTLTVSVNGEEYNLMLTPGQKFALAVSQRATGRTVKLKFSFDRTDRPSAFDSPDTRELGAFVTKIGN